MLVKPFHAERREHSLPSASALGNHLGSGFKGNMFAVAVNDNLEVAWMGVDVGDYTRHSSVEGL